VTSGGLVTYTDANGELWVAKPGVNGGNWKRPKDVLHCRSDRRAALTPSGSTWTTVQWETLVRDPYALYANASGLFTAPVAGVYAISVTCQIATGGQWIQITQNGSTTLADIYEGGGSRSITLTLPASYLNAGDTIVVQALGATAWTTNPGYNFCCFDYMGSG
jgi:hypothetical protein